MRSNWENTSFSYRPDRTEYSVSDNQVTASCPTCGKMTVFVSEQSRNSRYLYEDDAVYCENCGLCKTGRAFAEMKKKGA